MICYSAYFEKISYIEMFLNGFSVDIGEENVIIARMVKLADTLDSGSSGRKVVQVQVLFRALFSSIITFHVSHKV